jgi:hypothetical protein
MNTNTFYIIESLVIAAIVIFILFIMYSLNLFSKE